MSVAMLAACGLFFGCSVLAAVAWFREPRGLVYAVLAVACAVYAVAVAVARIAEGAAP